MVNGSPTAYRLRPPTTVKQSNDVESQWRYEGSCVDNKTSDDNSCRVVYYINKSKALADDPLVQVSPPNMHAIDVRAPKHINHATVHQLNRIICLLYLGCN